MERAAVDSFGTFLRSGAEVPLFSSTVSLPSGPSLPRANSGPGKPLKGRWHHRSSKEKWLTASGACPKFLPANDEQAGLDKAVEELYNLYCEVGKDGRLWSEMTFGKETHKQIFMRTFAGMSGQTIHGALCVVKRFRRWTRAQSWDEKAMPWHTPDAQAFGAWLLEVSKGGPTAAPSAWAQCEFLRAKVGVPFPTQADFVVGFKLAPTGHASTPAPTLQPWTLPRLLQWNLRQSGTTRASGQLVALIITGCVRFRHAQRSKMLSITADTITFRCRLGKSKVRGRETAV